MILDLRLSILDADLPAKADVTTIWRIISDRKAFYARLVRSNREPVRMVEGDDLIGIESATRAMRARCQEQCDAEEFHGPIIEGCFAICSASQMPSAAAPRRRRPGTRG